MDYTKKLARRTVGMETSAIREILKVVGQPGMISLAGGIPAPQSFDISALDKLHKVIFEKYGDQLYQYGITEGFEPLRQALTKYLKWSKKINISTSQIAISSGSQSALDAAAMVLIDPGDKVAVEAPTYLTAIKNFKSYQAELVSIPTDEEGVIPGEYEKVIMDHKIKVSYLIPTFQNPTGRTLSEKRRRHLAEIIIKHKQIVIEDDPYYELRYSGANVPPLYTYCSDNVIYLGSLSKIFSPGMRIGYYIAPPQISALMTSVRQGIDLHAAIYGQALASEYISGGYLIEHLPRIKKLYGERLQAMLSALEKYLPKGYGFSRPDGGMFVWVWGPKDFDSLEFYNELIKEKIAFVPGEYFYLRPGEGKNTMRLNFTTISIEKINEAVKIISDKLKSR